MFGNRSCIVLHDGQNNKNTPSPAPHRFAKVSIIK
jgi:hypothetical protein